MSSKISKSQHLLPLCPLHVHTSRLMNVLSAAQRGLCTSLLVFYQHFDLLLVIYIIYLLNKICIRFTLLFSFNVPLSWIDRIKIKLFTNFNISSIFFFVVVLFRYRLRIWWKFDWRGYVFIFEIMITNTMLENQSFLNWLILKCITSSILT